MQLASDSLIRDLINTTIRTRWQVNYSADTADRVLREYHAREHALRDKNAVVDFLLNAMRSCEQGQWLTT